MFFRIGIVVVCAFKCPPDIAPSRIISLSILIIPQSLKGVRLDGVIVVVELLMFPFSVAALSTHSVIEPKSIPAKS